MRFLPRLLHTGGAAVILIFLYLVWLQHDHLGHSIHEAWEGSAHRIVNFGDDWSDTGKYRVSPPPKVKAVTRDPDRGDIWIEALCREVSPSRLHDMYWLTPPSSVATSLTTLPALYRHRPML